MQDMPPRKRPRKPTPQAPLPTFNLTVESASPMSIVQDKLEIFRTVNLKFVSLETAQAFIVEMQKQVDEGSIPMVSVCGRVT